MLMLHELWYIVINYYYFILISNSVWTLFSLFTVLKEQRERCTIANSSLHPTGKRIVLRLRRANCENGNTFLHWTRDQGHRISISLLGRQKSILLCTKLETLLQRAGFQTKMLPFLPEFQRNSRFVRLVRLEASYIANLNCILHLKRKLAIFVRNICDLRCRTNYIHTCKIRKSDVNLNSQNQNWNVLTRTYAIPRINKFWNYLNWVSRPSITIGIKIVLQWYFDQFKRSKF